MIARYLPFAGCPYRIDIRSLNAGFTVTDRFWPHQLEQLRIGNPTEQGCEVSCMNHRRLADASVQTVAADPLIVATFCIDRPPVWESARVPNRAQRFD